MDFMPRLESDKRIYSHKIRFQAGQCEYASQGTYTCKMWEKLRVQSVMTVTSHPSLVTPTHVYSQSRSHPNSPWPNLNPSQAFPIHLQHSQSGEHHSQTHLTIPNEPKTSWIPLTNPELACSPLNLKTQYTQLQLGEAWMPSTIPDWVLFLSLVLISFCLSLPLSRSSCHSFPSSTLYPSSPYHTLPYLYTSVCYFSPLLFSFNFLSWTNHCLTLPFGCVNMPLSHFLFGCAKPVLYLCLPVSWLCLPVFGCACGSL